MSKVKKVRTDLKFSDFHQNKKINKTKCCQTSESKLKTYVVENTISQKRNN